MLHEMPRGSFTFPKSARLLKSGQFRRVAYAGKTLSGKHLIIQISTQASSRKLGLTVSRKFGNAVQRNLFKRRVRETFRLLQHQLPARAHFNVRPAAVKINVPSLPHIQEEFARLCSDTQP